MEAYKLARNKYPEKTVNLAVSSCSQPVGQAVYGVLFDVFSDKPYAVMIGTVVLSMIVSLYSKRIFTVLETESTNRN